MTSGSTSIHLNVDAIRVGYALGRQLHEVVHDLSFSLQKGEIGCLLGPSGCGKTTVLRAIAGFENLLGGRILIDGEELSSSSHTAAPEHRQVGVVFQDYALFPHLSVQDNVAFGLHRLPTQQARERVQHLLEMTGLSNQARKYPHELSGGQQQRVALARALAPRPRLLLLDEPFSNLDIDLRERLAGEVREILKELGTTAVLVTHDQHEAFAIADSVGVMRAGRIVQWDSAYKLYHQPADRFVADFIGQGVFLPGEVKASSDRVQIELGSLPLRRGLDSAGLAAAPQQGDLQVDAQLNTQLDAQLDVLLRADDVLHDDASPMQAEVVRKAFRGAEFLYTLKLPSGACVLALVPSHHDHAIGEKIGIRLAVDHVVTFPRQAKANVPGVD